MDILETFMVIVGVIAVGGVAIMAMIKRLIYICQPNEVLIFAGAQRRGPDGRLVGYRLVKGGRGIRIPLLERVARMDLTNIIIDLKVSGAYCRGGIPLEVEGVANIKVAGEEPIIHHAIERFLDRSRGELTRIAKETLEGNLRGVLASLTPEQVNEDKIAFARSLLAEAEDDLNKLGLVLDTLQIQNISDNVQYLDSIGRKQGAELLRDSRIAEARAKTASAVRSAENQQSTSLAQIDAEITKAQAEAKRRVLDALTMREALVSEQEAETDALVARTVAQVEVQKARIEELRHRLDADVVAPAEAMCKRAQAGALAKAAPIIEDGAAQVAGLGHLINSWQKAGKNARRIFLLQKLEPLLGSLSRSIQDVEVESLTIIDTSTGDPALKAASFVEHLKQASGIDLGDAVRALSAKRAPKV